MTSQLVENILFSSQDNQEYDNDQIIPELTLSYLVSGKKELNLANRDIVATMGDVALLRRNELLKSLKASDEDGREYQSISIFFTADVLRRYAVQNAVSLQGKYDGEPYVDLSRSPFIKAFFESLVPYFNSPDKLTDRIARLKTAEALELMLQYRSSLQKMIFDLSDPYKIDLEKYMNSNYLYNIPIKEFARLTGRSLSTFKRDFKTVYNSTPEKWLREKRLEVAYSLITEKGQKPSAVCFRVGFSNFSHFSTVFKEKYGFNASDAAEISISK